MRAAFLLVALGCGVCARAEPPAKVPDVVVLAKATVCGLAKDQVRFSQADEGSWVIFPSPSGQQPDFKAFHCFVSWAGQNGLRIGFVSEPPPEPSK